MRLNGMNLAAAVLAAALLARAPEAQQRPMFEVASVKRSAPDAQGMGISGPAPSQFTTRNAPLARIILYAYGRRDYQLADGPDWIHSERFDMVAKYPTSYSPADVPLMVQTLLEQRFRLRTHAETREGPIYSLVMAREDKRFGPALRKSTVDCVAYRAELKKSGQARVIQEGDPCTAIQFGRGLDRIYWGGNNAMSQIAANLSSPAGRDVVDRTGLAGEFDVRLQWRPDLAAGQNAAQAPVDGSEGVSLFTALPEQLGLKLQPDRGPVEFLVIDSVERPTPD